MLFPYQPVHRPSSPLNPHTSSSPPSTMSYFSTGHSSPTPPSQHKTRYKRPEVKKYTNSAPPELFAEGTTPTEAQMWRERFSRRMIDRERRKKNREIEVDRRRGPIHVEENEAKVLEDDEEIFRRLMVLQRQREQRNAQISFEQDNGGSDPISPDFWDDDDGVFDEVEERALQARLDASNSYSKAGPSNYNQLQTPPRRSKYPTTVPEQQEEEWAAEAARAEEAEREAEEMELARQVEESYRQHQQPNRPDQAQRHPNQSHHGGDGTGDTSIEVDDIEMDWDMDMDL